MKIRLLSSIVLIAFVIMTIFLFPPWAFTIVAALFIGFGLYELFVLFGNKGIIINKPLGISLGTLISGVGFFGLREDVVFISIFCLLFLFQFTRKNNSEAVHSISATLFGIFYVGWLFSFLVKIRLLDGGQGLVAFLLLITKSSDIGAYITGRRCGKHKLIPRLSPNKTIEGCIGGIVLSAIVAVISKDLLPFIFSAIGGSAYGGNLLPSVLLGVMLGILAQFGDLTESLIKRDCNAKDASQLVPGLGGILDIIDSILLTAPAFYIYLRFLR